MSENMKNKFELQLCSLEVNNISVIFGLGLVILVAAWKNIALASGTVSSFLISSTALSGRMNPSRWVADWSKSTKKPGPLCLSAVATASSNPVREKLLKWEQSAQQYYSMELPKPIEDVDQVNRTATILLINVNTRT